MKIFSHQPSLCYTFQAIFKHLSDILPPLLFDELCKKLPDNWQVNTQINSLDPSLFEQAKKLTLSNQQLTRISEPNLYSLFDDIQLAQTNTTKQKRTHFYGISTLSAQSIFHQKGDKHPAFNSAEIAQKTNAHFADFIAKIQAIPTAHWQNIPLWLDHFDTLLQQYFSHIACPYDNHIAYYDYLKIASAFYTCLALGEDKANPMLLIQGDFFGIQDFIFAGGGETNKQAAKLLRGRSFQVSLFTELAALKILQKCGLSSFHQVMNAAGKFLIIAPHTQQIKKEIEHIQNELNQWFLENTYGLAGLGIALQPANIAQFTHSTAFTELVHSLFQQLETVKLQRFSLTDANISVRDVNYLNGSCRLNSYFPASTTYNEKDKESGLSQISQDQIKIGDLLTKKDRLIICHYAANIYENYQTQSLIMNIFDYAVVFTDDANSTGDFSKLSKLQQIYRFWDISLPTEKDKKLWNGYARRYINAYIPTFGIENNAFAEKYQHIENKIEIGAVKTFDYLACEDRILNAKGQYCGQVALMTLKGDIDNLGTIFQKGLSSPNFAKMAALSRQINQFFSLWLPAYCAQKYPNTYTVFAGGDDFFLIGPWYSIQKLASEMEQAFKRYVAHNEDIHFSVGMVMTKVGTPVPALGAMAEEALEKAKEMEGKNAVTLYQIPVKWADWHQLFALEAEIARLAKDYNLSTSYLYSLIQFCYQAEDQSHIENTMWRSRFYYKTSRYVIDKLPRERKATALNQMTTSIGNLGIEKYRAKFSLPLFNYFYQQRN